MPNNTDQRTVSTLIRWTEDEWRTIARGLCAKQGGEPKRALDLQKIKAEDVFAAQEVLPEDRHRKLASIAQGFAGIRARLDAVTQRVPEGEQGTACAETTEVGRARRTASDTTACVSRASEQDMEASDQMTENAGLAAGQASERDVLPEQPRSRSMHQVSEAPARLQQHVAIPGLMEAMRPFLVMVCEEMANALVKAISAQGLRDPLPASSSQARSRVVSNREEALYDPVVGERQPNPSADKTTHEPHLVDGADMDASTSILRRRRRATRAMHSTSSPCLIPSSLRLQAVISSPRLAM